MVAKGILPSTWFVLQKPCSFLQWIREFYSFWVWYYRLGYLSQFAVMLITFSVLSLGSANIPVLQLWGFHKWHLWTRAGIFLIWHLWRCQVALLLLQQAKASHCILLTECVSLSAKDFLCAFIWKCNLPAGLFYLETEHVPSWEKVCLFLPAFFTLELSPANTLHSLLAVNVQSTVVSRI